MISRAKLKSRSNIAGKFLETEQGTRAGAHHSPCYGPPRTTFQSTAHAIKVSTTTLYRRFKCGDLKKHSNSIKPF